MSDRVVIVGAGPGGLEAARVAAERGHEVVILDDLSTGDAGRLASLPQVPLEVGSVRDRGMVRRVLRENG